MTRSKHPRTDLRHLARRALRERGFLPGFPPEVAEELAALGGPARDDGVRDLRERLLFAIDNDDSRDIDQLTAAEEGTDGSARVWVVVADVAARVERGSAIDEHARTNTTTLYTPAEVFPMLPERLSTDWTSLGRGDDRLAMVVELTVTAAGEVSGAEVYRARVRNHAQLVYEEVAAWLAGDRSRPGREDDPKGLAPQLRLQNRIAEALRERRQAHGALDLDTHETRTRVRDDHIEVTIAGRDPAHLLIEDLMIAANGAVARFLEGRGFPVFRRVVRTPERWDRIVRVAAAHGGHLPPRPDAPALQRFLSERRRRDPGGFGELSLAILKLLGKGEYVADPPGGKTPGHFGLAVRDYTHSTAPNRRFPDLITQRLLHAALAGDSPPYTLPELAALARHATEREDAANKVERFLHKAAAALLLAGREGERFDGVVTGASPKGTWARVFHPHVEGKVVEGWRGLDVGDRVRLQLLRTDPQRGFIDFACRGRGHASPGAPS